MHLQTSSVTDLRPRAVDDAARVIRHMLPSVEVATNGSLHVARSQLPLTPVEQELLELVPAALEDLRPIEAATATMPRPRMLEELLITRLLERRASRAAQAATASTVLTGVQELSTRREEGQAATCGVLVVDDLQRWRAHAATRDGVIIEPFAVRLQMDADFFIRPAAHHYVDGRRSFYLVGPDLEVAGLVRIVGEQCDALGVHAGQHLGQLLEGPPAWCATVDENSTVNVYGAGGLHLRRRTSHWRLLDGGILPTCLRGAGLTEADAATMAVALTALSESRTGTLVLVPTDDRSPQVAGMIDSSRCGAVLLTHLLGRSVAELRQQQALCGILSCDGMTVIDPSGELMLTGAIIDLAGGYAARSGGGRTHAAQAASASGLAVMVSADGQVTAFRGGRVLVHLER